MNRRSFFRRSGKVAAAVAISPPVPAATPLDPRLDPDLAPPGTVVPPLVHFTPEEYARGFSAYVQPGNVSISPQNVGVSPPNIGGQSWLERYPPLYRMTPGEPVTMGDGSIWFRPGSITTASLPSGVDYFQAADMHFNGGRLPPTEGIDWARFADNEDGSKS